MYRGDFAALLNRVFPDRPLYLFDTFSGFDKTELAHEGDHTHTKDFSNTSIDLVMGKMTHPGRCLVRTGVFPKTTDGISDQFVFVSIDADLFDPTYAGLRFFFPKLVRGGYIFIHDFNNHDWPGVAKAVRQYCSENELSFLLLPDVNGTAVTTK